MNVHSRIIWDIILTHPGWNREKTWHQKPWVSLVHMPKNTPKVIFYESNHLFSGKYIPFIVDVSSYTVFSCEFPVAMFDYWRVYPFMFHEYFIIALLYHQYETITIISHDYYPTVSHEYSVIFLFFPHMSAGKPCRPWKPVISHSIPMKYPIQSR